MSDASLAIRLAGIRTEFARELLSRESGNKLNMLGIKTSELRDLLTLLGEAPAQPVDPKAVARLIEQEAHHLARLAGDARLDYGLIERLNLVRRDVERILAGGARR